MNPLTSTKTIYNKISGYLMIGGFPGFVWGWFHVPDHEGLKGISQLAEIYAFPFLGAIITLVLFLILQKIFTKKNETTIISIFAAAAVACYYWYRIPSLVGFGLHDNDGMLLNLRNTLPQWIIYPVIVSATIFFFWWIVFRPSNRNSWVVRPDYAVERGNVV
jgi:hypothetical protein